MGESMALQATSTRVEDKTISIRKDQNVNEDIEALRAIAIVLVIISHSFALFTWEVPELMKFLGTFRFLSGVDLFFCVSGFVITRSLTRQGVLRRSFWDVAKPFWTRRIFRLWPSAWLWASIILIASALAPEQYWIGNFMPTLHDFFAAVLNYMDVRLQLCSERGTCGSTMFTIFWSLSLEEQFYIVYPFLICLMPRRALIGTCIVGIVAQFFISRQPGSTILFFLRTDAILFGVLLALLFDTDVYRKLDPRFLRNGWIAAPVLLALICLLAFIGNASFAPVNTGLVAIISALLVLIASFDRNYIIPDFPPLHGAVRWVGSRSYTIYLVHLPSFWITKIAWAYYLAPGRAFYPTFMLRFVVTALIVCVVLAEANYRLVEQPFRDWGRALTKGMQARVAS